ncbi:hypothetical protein HYX13_05480, partial [Candidatus Woesearchaeota archaeon]|nr:hypothetical protein [Candidatus Woesearchaeota archaeon]
MTQDKNFPYVGTGRLLVRREPIILIETKGKSFTSIEIPVPELLKKPLVTVSNARNITLVPSTTSLSLLLEEIDIHEEAITSYKQTTRELDLLWDFHHLFQKKINYWSFREMLNSGRRSVLYSSNFSPLVDETELYRIKGVSLRPRNPQVNVFEDGTISIYGGQKLRNVIYERRMSRRFNRVLCEEGITPVMEYCGMWKYPVLAKGYRPAASIWKVEGDTRIDEFRTAVELRLENRLKEAKVKKLLNSFYYQTGYIVGQLLELMHRSGQSWSCDSGRTNAHMGNVVIYRVAEDTAKIGLVDFDASCDLKDFSKAKLKEVQKKDLTDLVNYIHNPEP